jgi:hypothetical protein
LSFPQGIRVSPNRQRLHPEENRSKESKAQPQTHVISTGAKRSGETPVSRLCSYFAMSGKVEPGEEGLIAP